MVPESFGSRTMLFIYGMREISIFENEQSAPIAFL